MRKCLIKLVAGIFMLMVFLCIMGHPVSASPPKSDSDILSASFCGNCLGQRSSQNYVPTMQVRHQSFVAKYNPVTLTFTGLMYFYQKVVSPQIPSTCLYEHSCSSFSKGLIAEYGLAKGVFTTADRLMRCNRMAATDIHPLVISEQSGKVMETVNIYKIKSE
jgi:putative component of membrane protein insertase Oxa1/YidC/SpoIIIJ protein YidD